jgi:hypothetical protein
LNLFQTSFTTLDNGREKGTRVWPVHIALYHFHFIFSRCSAFLIIAHLLKRCNCDNTLLAFQKEVRTSLNLIDSVDAFVYEVTHGRWNVVLETILCFKLPVGKLIKLYEHV